MTPRKQVIAVAAILAVAGIVDFVQRIHVPRSPATRDSDIGRASLPAEPLSLASARERLQSWFPAQQPGPAEMLGDAQAQGEDVETPDRADIAGWRFVLRGVFSAGAPFAVFDVQPSAGGEVEQHRVSAGDSIKGVSVERIAGHRVSLSDGKDLIELALFIDTEDEMAAAGEHR